MEIGMVGLGRMGANMARRLMRDGHELVVYDRDPQAVAALVAEGAVGVDSLEALVAELKRPRAVWVMVPAGEATEETVITLGCMLDGDDIVIDGGNTYFKDDVRRADLLASRGIAYVDVGTSGGVWGLERGYCLMVGGPDRAVAHLEPVFRSLAPGAGDVAPTVERGAEGYLHCGPAGAGHFVKMIHNGIEYGLMQAYAEGFDIFRNAGYDFDLSAIAELWRRGSVVGSWLLDLTAAALAEDPELARYTGFVEDSGEGRWTVQAAIEEAVPADVLTAALFTRFRSRRDHTFAEKILSAMRMKFGGHVEQV
jgi:6-phosphogluconate dehydrogenase